MADARRENHVDGTLGQVEESEMSEMSAPRASNEGFYTAAPQMPYNGRQVFRSICVDP